MASFVQAVFMKNVLFVYPPFAPVTTPPYSITNLVSFLDNNLPDSFSCEVFDANLMIQRTIAPQFFSFIKEMKTFDHSLYVREVKKYDELMQPFFTTLDKGSVEKLYQKITAKDPTYVAFSVLFESQALSLPPLLQKLRSQGYRVVCGGPAITEDIKRESDAILQNELELLSYLLGRDVAHDDLNFESVLDFSRFSLSSYATPQPAIAFRTTTSCYYRKCSYCVHPTHNAWYYEYPLAYIRNALEKSGARHVFFTDDLIHVKRLRELGKVCSDLGIRWMCQLRPSKELTPEILEELHDTGLSAVWWGVESGNQETLDAMKKGTVVEDMGSILDSATQIGIRNGVFVMFGFPGETEQMAEQTIQFLRRHAAAIDLISPSAFELYEQSPVFCDPASFGVFGITKKNEGIGYHFSVSCGMDQHEAQAYIDKKQKVFEEIATFPLAMNRFRTHLLFF